MKLINSGKLYLILVIIFITPVDLLSQFNTWERKDCWADNPTYFTTKKISVYSEMSANSAITMDIEASQEVKVTNSFFGDNGWWEICYQGKNGWVKKAYLTRQKVGVKTGSTQKSTSSQPMNSEDVGFNPFLAKTNSMVNFRVTPTTKGELIRLMPTNTELYVFSDKANNGFYKVIDISSGKVGWIDKKAITYTGVANVNSSGAFTSSGTTANYNSTVTIKNKSSSKITLVIGEKTFYLMPYTTETKYIVPGKIYYVATAPNVIPSSGYQTFSSYKGYKWEFWIE